MLSLNILRCEKSEFVFFNLFLTLFVLSWSVWGLGSNRYLCVEETFFKFRMIYCDCKFNPLVS
ncbi:hypothetical protein OIU76_005394 [Salix suchowensis]|nr:hypothetical protein OIU76_005394 [Salix suchowensis]